MALLPTGSNKILEINTSEVNIVIKSKKNWQGITLDRSSSIVVDGHYIKKINIEAVNICEKYDPILESASYSILIPPVFFEQTDYEIVIRSTNGKNLSFWNENYAIRDKISPIFDGDNTGLSGVINFDNFVGYSDLEISLGGKRYLIIRVEVFPTKISYKEDYQQMINDISEMVCEAAIEFMAKTYEKFSLGDSNSSILAVYFQILRTIFEEYMRAVNRIVVVPHHKLITEHVVVPQHKVKKTDRTTVKWLMNHQEYVRVDSGRVKAEKVLAAKKQITYDTSENRFVKYILKSTVAKLKDFINRYQKSVSHTEEKVLTDANNMIRDILRVVNTSFLKDVTEYSAAQSMSLVFGMAPGYRELYKCYIMLQRSLSVNGDIFNISVKDTAQLYEYWCFVKLYSILKKEYKLASPDIIKVDNSGITITLKHGNPSKARFINPKTGEEISLFYNPTESKTQTVNQRPDNVLELEKKGSEVSYKYVFDAKYRIETNTESGFYPDNKPGPRVDDINTMHRYRDSIVYENPQSRFAFEKTMFGAYILFPYDKEEEYKEHKFYKSIESVNIGGLPFLPGATSLVQKLLADLINDSKESAFERATLPRGIEEKLQKVDWEKRDVLVGVFRSYEQFKVCKEHNFYYTPVKNIPDAKLPIHYVAMYETNEMYKRANRSENGQVKYYGEVLRVAKVKRSSIKEVPMSRNNPDELYYKFYVRNWEDITKHNELKRAILPKESGFIVEYTNLFLLEHSEYVQELLIKNEDEYRLYSELKRASNATEVNGDEKLTQFSSNGCQFVFSDGEIIVVRSLDGTIIVKKQICDFGKRPSQVFRQIQDEIMKRI